VSPFVQPLSPGTTTTAAVAARRGMPLGLCNAKLPCTKEPFPPAPSHRLSKSLFQKNLMTNNESRPRAKQRMTLLAFSGHAAILGRGLAAWPSAWCRAGDCLAAWPQPCPAWNWHGPWNRGRPGSTCAGLHWSMCGV
jgi:hypothetical protein